MQEVWKQVEACRRYENRQRLAGGMEAGRGLPEVWKQSTTYACPIVFGRATTGDKKTGQQGTALEKLPLKGAPQGSGHPHIL